MQHEAISTTATQVLNHYIIKVVDLHVSVQLSYMKNISQ